MDGNLRSACGFLLKQLRHFPMAHPPLAAGDDGLLLRVSQPGERRLVAVQGFGPDRQFECDGSRLGWELSSGSASERFGVRFASSHRRLTSDLRRYAWNDHSFSGSNVERCRMACISTSCTTSISSSTRWSEVTSLRGRTSEERWELPVLARRSWPTTHRRSQAGPGGAAPLSHDWTCHAMTTGMARGVAPFSASQNSASLTTSMLRS